MLKMKTCGKIYIKNDQEKYLGSRGFFQCRMKNNPKKAVTNYRYFGGCNMYIIEIHLRCILPCTEPVLQQVQVQV